MEQIMADIGEATDSYEEWLHRQVSVVRDDLETKHELMADDAFTFLRATYYRWTALWPERCAPLADAPPVLAVGDLHTENFGTWRDADGRLAWGVNDFDEAYPLPYTSDLDLGDLPGQRDERRLLRAMGKETANIHCGSPEDLPAVVRHLDGLHDGWLLGAARTMTKALRQDWRAWRARQRSQS